MTVFFSRIGSVVRKARIDGFFDLHSTPPCSFTEPFGLAVNLILPAPARRDNQDHGVTDLFAVQQKSERVNVPRP